jgi:hypothetical protein
MSSTYVRTNFKNYITTTVPAEKFIDLTGEYNNIQDLIAHAGINRNAPWVGIQFIGNGETPVSVVADGITGTYRETGAIYLHICAAHQIGVVDGILARSEVLINSIRGRRIGDMTIDEITPPNFDRGATLDFEGGYTAASVIIAYTRDLNL